MRRHVVPTPTQKAEKRDPTEPEKRGRRPWHELMMRVFAIDVLACSVCDGRMRIISTITDPDVIIPSC